jgi:phosphoserine aminotransferase
MKKYNFYAGPAILPQYAIEKTAEAVKEFDGMGLSILEISHRSPQFDAVMKDAQSLMKELLEVPEGYAVPFNLFQKKAAYLNTGTWATKAIKESQKFGETIVVASSEDDGFKYIPKGYEVPADADYFHITTNNTIKGTQIHDDLDVPVPLVADMSSDILSRPMDVSKYGIIYGGAQKNLAPAGVTFIIVKEDILGKVDRDIPTMIDYRTHIKKSSMFNTPPVVCVFSVLKTLEWLKDQGGLSAMAKKNQAKSDLLYAEIDRNKLFVGTAYEEDRSLMNVTFVMKEEYADLSADFFEFATGRGLIGVKGHRSVGGFRASIYNAMPLEGIQTLVDCMKEFEAQQ